VVIVTASPVGPPADVVVIVVEVWPDPSAPGPRMDAPLVIPGQPSGAHASQQLVQVLTTPPALAHASASRRKRHLVRPDSGLAMQQVTYPGLPQVDNAAQRWTSRRHSGRNARDATRFAAVRETQRR
jgi:hypothetical protein